METRGAAFELSHGSSRSMIKRVLLLYRYFLCTWTIEELHFFRVILILMLLLFARYLLAIKLESPRAFVINFHSEKVDFVVT